MSRRPLPPPSPTRRRDARGIPRPRPARRTVPVALASLAVVAALTPLVLGRAGSGEPVLAAVATAHAGAHATATSAPELALRQGMRALWEEHVFWTRLAIVDFAAGLPSLPATQARLLRNQSDIGDAVATYYGAAAGRRVTTLLREHIAIAVDVLVAAKAGDAPALAAAQSRWNVNADQIADFLWRANPASWKRAEMRRMMRAHLALTTAEAVARLNGRHSADVRAFDAVEVQARAMADMLTDGIVRQFPARFR